MLDKSGWIPIFGDKMKKILFIIGKRFSSDIGHRIHYDWVEECKDIFEIKLWGSKYVENTSLVSLQKEIDSFRPDYIYMTHRRTISQWLPDLTNIKVPKIFVEVDTYKYNSNDSWYKQFDKVMCREPFWGHKHSPIYGKEFFKRDIQRCCKYKNIALSDKELRQKIKYHYRNYLIRLKKSKTWGHVPFFCWSVSEKDICCKIHQRSGVKFIARSSRRLYPVRDLIKKRFYNSVLFSNVWEKREYTKEIKNASALLCPTESFYGDFIPAKLFEFLASGSAVITNCDFNQAGIPELEQYAIKYNSFRSLKRRLHLDFTPYYDSAIPLMRNHTHRVRYKEIFG